MKKTSICLAFFLLFSLNLLSKDVLIIYDGKKGQSEAYKSAYYIHNILYHFSVDENIIAHTSDYKTGMVNNRDFTFIIFEEGIPSFPEALIHDVMDTKRNIIWIHMHIDKLLDVGSEKWGISHQSIEYRKDWKVTYKGAIFSKEDFPLNIIKIRDARKVKIHSSIENSRGNKYPYILNSKNLWYIADTPFSSTFEEGRFLVFADILHDIFKEHLPLSHRALVRIEDVSPETDPSSLERIADYLDEEEIPFQVSLIPIFKDPYAQNEVCLSEKPDLVKTLKYMVSKGGTIILHGITHQHRGISGSDYEFWDDITGGPILHESPAWVDQRLKRGFSECLRNGIYPLLWETPHYAASSHDYKTIAKYFDTFNDRGISIEGDNKQIFPYPYPIFDKDIGVKVVPENLGYIDLINPDPASIIKNSRNLLVVRDGLASFFFHPFVSLKYLKTVVKKMKRIGWKFVSIRDFGCNFRTDSLWVTSSGDEGGITLANQYLHEIHVTKECKIKENFSKTRQKKILSKKIDLPDSSFYVMEALSLLPEERKGESLGTLKTPIFEILRGKKERSLINITKCLILSTTSITQEEDCDQKSYESVLRIFGFSPEIRERKELKNINLDSFDLLVVPYPSAKELNDIEINTILDFIEKGGILITDGKTNLAEKFGIRFENRTIKISEVKELSMPAQNLTWNPPVVLNPPSSENFHVLLKDIHRNIPLAMIKSIKEGKVLFFSATFDPYTPFGTSRFPYFPHYLKNSLGIPFNFKRNNLEFYFDPGYRQNTSWENLVKRWKESGVKIVYLAAWHFYRNYTFDYKYLIDLCHKQGIIVYAWFEFPQVSPLFWEVNPHFRETTATGKDALCHWRMLMNLYNFRAREAVKKFLWKVMTDFDWDGVNLAEIHFDTNEGARDPSKFTPMNRDVRKDFKKNVGFDPIELFNSSSPYYWEKNQEAFNKFLKFRTNIVKELHISFLSELEKIKSFKKKNMETIVTALDTLNHPELIEECGVDIRDIIDLMDRFPFTLQVEDPSRSWIDSPSRYLSYYNIYKKYIKDPKRLMFDINIIARRDVSTTYLPSATATGTELATALFYAIIPSGRIGIYSEYTIHPFDMDILPFVMGSDTLIEERKEGFLINAKKPCLFPFNHSSFIPYLNNERWPFFGINGICIPSGTHILSFRKSSPLIFHNHQPSVILDGDIYNLKLSKNIYRLRYHSSTPVPLRSSKPLEKITLDSFPLPLFQGERNVILPKGDHELEISTGGQLFFLIDKLGYLSSSLFYILGFFSACFLTSLYVYTRVKR